MRERVRLVVTAEEMASKPRSSECAGSECVERTKVSSEKSDEKSLLETSTGSEKTRVSLEKSA